MTREIYVFGDWQELGGPTFIGSLRAQRTHGKETFSFEYDPEWLESDDLVVLDPDLQFFSGPQYLSDRSRTNFGFFLDSCPDRWGELLMKRREARAARLEKRPSRTLMESDFIIGVHDEQRLGGLRFKTVIDGEFLATEQGQDVPAWAQLRELENAAWQFQSDKALDSDNKEWLRLLLAPGSSIGGARPKAGVSDENQNLWIAKFPGTNDQIDVGAWEWITHQLAKDAGVNVAEAKAEKFGLQHHTFLVKRFDRIVENGQRRRKHFASAMTMLGYSDGTNFEQGVSYLEIVEFLMRYGAEPTADMRELWRRIVFSICVSNTDDHLRNHGFLLQPDGWKLSPAYDLNPVPASTGLSLNISETDNALDVDLALEVAEFFRLDEKEARSILSEIEQSVAQWQSLARKFGISRGERDLMRSCFNRIQS